MPLVEVKLLGPLEVAVDGRPVELRRRKQRALLALLALRAGEVVSTDRLVDELWGETPPKAAVGSLQNLVSDLRKLIGADRLLTRPPGYVLELGRQFVDAHRFEDAVHAGGDLREALALWRGPALADLTFEPFAQAEIARLEELRATAWEQLFDRELERGRHAQLVAELEAFVAEHPLRERPRGQLMLALYRSGRQADALEAYRQARETLVEELGIDPSSELQQLEQAILRQDPALALEGAERAPSEPDRRRTVTVLFADIVGSTELSARLDPEVLRGVMTRYFDAVRTTVERHGGVVEKFIGDAAMAVFGVPTSHEDDAVRAVRAAAELREAIGALNHELAGYGVALQLRMGLNSGEVLVSGPESRESFATGKAVSVAMRLQQAAPPGEIVLGESVYRLARHAVTAEPVEPLELGAAVGRVTAYRLLEIGEAVRPLGGARLVGREDELAWLRAAFAGVRAERRSRVVTLLGDAGVGKTRLASELLSGLGRDESSLVGRCVSYGEGATFLPLAEIVHRAVPERPRQTVASLLRGHEQAHLIAERVTNLAGGAEGVASTGEVFWAVRLFFEALALQRPLVVVLEDIHWAEPTLLDLVEYLDAWSAQAPLLVLCIARPDVLERRPGWAASEKTLRLAPLAAEEAQTLVDELAGEELGDKARAKILDVGEGNPLFLEQLLAFSDEAGAEAVAAVPPTVEALLAGRIDRLESEERALLERGAVSGREFALDAVVHLSPPEEVAGTDRRLAALTRRGLIEPVDGMFRFHHALIRDVVYAGLTKDTRAELHERVGNWLEQRHEGAEEIVGYHLEQAYRYRAELQPGAPSLPSLAQRAGERLADAGIRAWKRADNAGAVNLLGRATPLLQDVGQRANILCELGTAQRSADVHAAGATLSEAVACAREARDRRIELRAQIELLSLRLSIDREADPGEVVQLVADANPVFEELGDDRALGRAWRVFGFVRGSMEGRCAEWLDAAERAAMHYRRTGWSPAGCLQEAAMALFHGPTAVSEALPHCEQLLDQTTDRLGRANVLVYLAGLHVLAEHYDEGFALLDDADRTYDELSDSYSRANNGARIRGGAYVLCGELESAEAVLRDSCATLERVGDKPSLASVAAELAAVMDLQGRLDEADSWSRFAREHAPAGDKIAQVHWRSVEGKVSARKGRVDEGEALVREALELADTTDALSHRGAVRLDLASVLSSSRRYAEATSHINMALQLFEAKGNLAAAGLAQARLAELAVA